MTKFWGAVLVVFLIGLAATFSTANDTTKLEVNDLETECRYDRNEDTSIRLNQDNSLSFKGHFPVNSIESNLDYRYSSGDDIVLNVRSQNQPVPQNFWNNCLASAVYDFDTQQLEPGSYPVTVKHNGERIEKVVIRVKG